MEDETRRSVQKRRQVLQALGATAAGAAFVGSSSATRSSDVDVAEVMGPEARTAVETASDTSAFDELRAALKEDGLSIDTEDTNVYYREDSRGTPHHVVEFPVVELTGALAITLKNGSFDSARASARVLEGDSITTDWYTIDDGVRSESVIVNTETMAVEDADEISSAISACDAWSIIGDVVCAMSCGAATAVICALAGIGTIAGAAACGAIFAGFCSAMAIANEELTGSACSTDANIEFTVKSRATAS